MSERTRKLLAAIVFTGAAIVLSVIALREVLP